MNGSGGPVCGDTSVMFPRYRLRLPNLLMAGWALLFVGLLSPVTRAEAHAIIVSSKPAANSQVPAGPLDILLQFNSLIDADLSRLDVVDPSGKIIALSIKSLDKGALASQATADVPGKWTLRWQVLSVDGHITRGEIPFSVVAKTVP
jgi:methionine-rich copper-binding protein CopC